MSRITFNHISDELLAAYVNHDLSSKEEKKIKKHLQNCEDCFEHLINFKKMINDNVNIDIEGRRVMRARRRYFPFSYKLN